MSPALPQCAGATNLFQEKRPSDLASMGYSPAKKKGGRHLHCTGISPRDADAFEQYPSDKDDSNNADYSHTPAYKASRNTKPKKKRDNKVKLDSSYLVCLRPLRFHAKLFSRGHLQVYSSDKIVRFDTEYQKRLSFNFSATRASRKKSATMLDARSSCHRDVDLDIAPSLFSRNTTNRLKLSRYILEDLLNCKVDCCIIVCIWSGAKGDETEASYSDQARSIASSRNNSGITTELWRMSGDMYHVLQGTISRSSFSNEVMTGNLSESRFLHYLSLRGLRDFV